MNGLEISNLLSHNENVVKYFKGIYASDQLKGLDLDPPYFIIVNTDIARNTGLHWICVFVLDGKRIEFFDSIGNYPFIYNRFISDFILNSSYLFYSKNRIQNFSTPTCGNFCVMFSYLRCNGYSFKDILNLFSSNLELNEQILRNFFSNLQF